MSATGSLPSRGLLEDTSPDAVLSLLGALAEAAIAAHVDLVDFDDIVLTLEGRLDIVPGEQQVPTETWAPEAERSGPTLPTLSFSLAMLGVLAVLGSGSVDQAPDEEQAHKQWLGSLLERLEVRWRGEPGAVRALDWLARCLAFDPFARPRPRQVLEAFGDPKRLPPAPPALSILTASSRVTRQSALSGIRSPPRPPAALFVWLTAILAVLSLTIATCTLGALVRHWALPDAVGEQPLAEDLGTPLPNDPLPREPFPREPLPSEPLSIEPSVTSAPLPKPVSIKPTAAGEPPAQAPAPVPPSGSDLRDPWR